MPSNGSPAANCCVEGYSKTSTLSAPANSRLSGSTKHTAAVLAQGHWPATADSSATAAICSIAGYKTAETIEPHTIAPARKGSVLSTSMCCRSVRKPIGMAIDTMKPVKNVTAKTATVRLSLRPAISAGAAMAMIVGKTKINRDEVRNSSSACRQAIGPAPASRGNGGNPSRGRVVMRRAGIPPPRLARSRNS